MSATACCDACGRPWALDRETQDAAELMMRSYSGYPAIRLDCPRCATSPATGALLDLIERGLVVVGAEEVDRVA